MNSSLQYSVKNYNVDLFTPDGQPEWNVVIKDGWYKHDSYHLKANMVDSSHGFNIGLAKMLKDIYTDKLPFESRYAVDGFPMLMYHNNQLHGVYTFNMKQHRKLYNMEKDSTDHFVYRAEENSAMGAVSFRAWSDKDIESEWEERVPKRDMNDWIQFPDGDPNYPAYNPENPSSGKHPDLRKLIKWVYNSTDEEFKRDLGKKIKLNFMLDYYILCYVFGMVDSLGKNMTLATWGRGSDGESVWYPLFYDMDTQIGFDNKGEFIHDADLPCPEGYNTRTSELWDKFIRLFSNEIKARYSVLRRANLNMQTVEKYTFGEVINLIGEKFYNLDNENKYIPYGKGYNFMAKGDRAYHVRRWMEERFLYCDTMLGFNAQTAESIIIRNTKSGEFVLKVKTYSPMMVTIDFGGTTSTSDGIQTRYCSDKEFTEFKFTFDGVYQRDISISGAKHIMELEGLDGQTLLMLDIQHAERLVSISCKDNPALTQLNTKNCKYLRSIDCTNNTGLVGALDLTGCVNLKHLNVSNTNITGVDVSTCRNLKSVNISNTKISTLILNNNMYLDEINFDNCALLSKISLSGCMMLEDFIVHNTGLREVELIDCDNLVTFDVANNPGLEKVVLDDMQNLKTINVNNCTNITEINAPWCPNLESLETQNCSKITKINIAGSSISELDTYSYASLKYLDITGTTISTVRFTANNGVETLIIADTPISTLEFYNLRKLKLLNISGTNITNVTELLANNLISLNVAKTQIEELTLISASNLEYLNITGSLITDMDLSSCTALRSLVLSTKEANNTHLRTLDVSNTPMMTLNFYDSDDMKASGLVLLKAMNMQNLNLVRASKKINSVDISNSKLLNVTWSDKFTVPSPLLSKNNMANYTRVTVNDSMLSPADILALQNGEYYIDSDEVVIKVLDGVLAGMVFNVNYVHQELPLEGMAINLIFPDEVVATHIKELLGKESLEDKVTQIQLDTISWFGANPQFVNVDHKGYFSKKKVVTFRGINYLRNLEYFNIAECNYTGEIKLYFPKLKSLDYAFYGCTSLIGVTSTTSLDDMQSMKYTFKNCMLLTNIILPTTMYKLEDVTGMFENCLNITDIVSSADSPNLKYANRAFYGCTNLRYIKLPVQLLALIEMTDMFGQCEIDNVSFHSSLNVSRCEDITLLREILKSAKSIDFSNLTNLLDLYLCEENQSNDILEELDISNTKIVRIDFTAGETKVTKLNTIFANNTKKFVTLKAPVTLKKIFIEDSLLLNPPSLETGIPGILLSENNLADYTVVKIDGMFISSVLVERLKNGTLVVYHNQKIEIMDGILEGKIFTTCIGMPIIELFPDGTLATHIQERTGKSTIYDIVNKTDLGRVTWIGRAPDDTANGYFYNKVVTTFEGIEYLTSLEYLNVSRAIFSEIDLSLNSSIKNLNYAFDSCISLQEVRLPVDSSIETMIGSFNNCNNVNKVVMSSAMPNVTTMESAFSGCINLKEIKIPQVLPVLNTSTATGGGLYRTFNGCSLTKVEFFNPLTVVDMNTITLMDALITAVTELDLSMCTNLEVLKLSVGTTNNSKLLKLDISNTKLLNVDLDTGLNTVTRNLLYLVARNTNIETLKVRNMIREVDVTGSQKLLSMVYNFESEINIPPILLFANGMANFTLISINGRILDDTEILELKNGVYKGIEDPSHIEIIDGCLAGTVLNVKYFTELPDTGLPLKSIFLDPVLCEHVKDRVGRTSVNDIVTYYDLDRVTWLGTRETSLTSISYFTGKTVNDWRGIEHLRNLTIVNINGVNSEKFYYAYTNNKIDTFRASNSKLKIINMSKLSKVTTLALAFTYCSELYRIIMPKRMDVLTTASGAFLDCKKLPGVTFPISMEKLSDIKDMFNGCSLIDGIVFPSHMPLLRNMQYSFFGCSNMKSITLPTTAPELYDMQYCFSECATLEEVIFPREAPKLINLNSTFLRATKMQRVQFPDELPQLTMMDSTFRLCENMTTMDITCNLPKLTYMSRVWESCPKLETLKFRGQMPLINEVSYCFEYTRNIKYLSVVGMINAQVSILTGINTGNIAELDISHNMKMYSMNFSSWTVLKKLTARHTALTSLTLPQAITHLYIDYSTGLRNFNPLLYPALIEFTHEGVDIQ